MRKSVSYIYIICVVSLLSVFSCGLTVSCVNDQVKGTGVFTSETEKGSELFDLQEIQNVGELIVLTVYGPSTYFEYHGEGFGAQYMLADAFAKSIGVALRVEVCRDKDDLIDRLRRGEGDLIACGLPVAVTDSIGGEVAAEEEDEVTLCGEKEITHLLDTLAVVNKDRSRKSGAPRAWAVRSQCVELQAALNGWLAKNEDRLLSYASLPVRSTSGFTYHQPRRSARPEMLNPGKGIISTYDHLFKKYAQRCGWDWKLLAAQAFTESGFDANAVSWMGAMGLMQLMPSTARQYGVSERDVFNPESNVNGAVKLISSLQNHYSGIANRDERLNFVLAAYNAGSGHVDDARRLAAKYKKNPNVWRGNVDSLVLKMSQPEYYNDSVVKYGYFRGSETFNYVRSIRSRWERYNSRIPRGSGR